MGISFARKIKHQRSKDSFAGNRKLFWTNGRCGNLQSSSQRSLLGFSKGSIQWGWNKTNGHLQKWEVHVRQHNLSKKQTNSKLKWNLFWNKAFSISNNFYHQNLKGKVLRATTFHRGPNVVDNGDGTWSGQEVSTYSNALMITFYSECNFALSPRYEFWMTSHKEWISNTRFNPWEIIESGVMWLLMEKSAVALFVTSWKKPQTLDFKTLSSCLSDTNGLAIWHPSWLRELLV